MAKPVKLVYFDTETGGLDSRSLDLLTFGAVIVDEEWNVHERYFELSLPSYRYQPKALEINGLSLPRLQKEGLPLPEFFDAVDRIMSLDATFIAHNFPFDEKFVNELYYRMQKDPPGFARNHIDTKSEAVSAVRRGLLPAKSKTNLKDLCEHFGISTLGHHGALLDAHMCRNLLHKLDELYVSNPVAY